MGNMAHSGLFITFEGPEGSGKSTQIRHLKTALEAEGFDVLHTREPGGTPISDAIRAILLDKANTELSPRAETLLYNAARAQLIDEVIRPALAAGKIVLCDRYADSTTAYQGYGRNQSLEAMQTLWQFATQSLTPDLTILFDLDPLIGLQRKQAGDEAEWNRIEAESIAFHERVYRGYLALAQSDPERWLAVDATATIDELRQILFDTISPRLREGIRYPVTVDLG